MKKLISVFRSIEESFLNGENRQKYLYYLAILQGLIFIIQNNGQSNNKIASYFALLIVGLACSLIVYSVIKNLKIGLMLLVVTSPIHFLPVGNYTSIIPVKSLSFYIATLIIIFHGLQIKDRIKKRKDKLDTVLALIFLGILLSIMVSVLNSPVIQILPLNFEFFKEVGSFQYIIALGLMFAICLGSVLILQVQDEETLNFMIECAFIGWLVAVTFGVLGLIFIIFGSGANFYNFANSYRPTSTFYSVTSAGGYIAILLPIAIYRMAKAIDEKELRASVILFLVCLIAIMVIIATTSRSAYLIVIFILISLLVLFFKRRMLSFLITLLLLHTIMGGAVWKYPPTQLVVFGAEKMPSTTQKWGEKSYIVQRINDNHETRIGLIKNSLELWMENRLTGVGFGAVSNNMVGDVKLSETHNFIVTISVEQGIVGVIAYFALLMFIARLIFNSTTFYRDPLLFHPYALFILIGVSIHHSFHLNFYTVWSWVVVGISITTLRRRPILTNDSDLFRTR